MNLNQLVAIRNSIESISTKELNKPMQTLARSINVGLLDIEATFPEESNEVRSAYATIENNMADIKKSVDCLLEKINKEILRRSSHFKVRGAVLDQIPVVDKVNAETDRRLRHRMFPPEIKFDIVSRIQLYTSAQYPALEIGPGDGQFTPYMVAGDPLYLVDINREFLDKTLELFPIEYQKRVRTYQIDTHGFGDNDLSNLPQNQFGFVLAIDVMDFYTWDFVSDYLKNIYQVLRPGGVLMFTYNNCEDAYAVNLVERGVRGWATEQDLRQLCHDIGYEIITTKNIPGQTYWAEIRKPGKLETIKIQQAMGEIVAATG
jgi:SAM-dependent methyltransferase